MELTAEQRAEIEKRVKTIEADREKFMAEANRQLGAFDGALSALRVLLTENSEAHA